MLLLYSIYGAGTRAHTTLRHPKTNRVYRAAGCASRIYRLVIFTRQFCAGEFVI